MGEKKIDPNWRHLGRLLSVVEVAAITGYSYDSILELRKARKISASLNRKPYRFDPQHIYEVFFSGRSLKTEKTNSIGHKPASKEDLWID